MGRDDREIDFSFNSPTKQKHTWYIYERIYLSFHNLDSALYVKKMPLLKRLKNKELSPVDLKLEVLVQDFPMLHSPSRSRNISEARSPLQMELFETHLPYPSTEGRPYQ